ncbi:MAG: molybdopterin-dependent oxidoreductase, partial [Gammaproteobacteria bacterium]|nr:molybdopterin-dependent oxidoreductase [Stutzerimonas stutzeri]NIW85167.1 molybdopterin-dependent oxidoreductase [Gammaproteobacteria bacterium]
GFEDVYRQRWTWDRIAKGTHYVNCWYQRGCAFDVYVKDGIVWREEQVATYPQTNPEVPDYNPRGCQKGACYTARMYDASRVRHPLKRAGARGEGKWKRISWDQALREIGDASVDVITTDGPGSIFFEQGTSFANGAHTVALYRTHAVL